MAASREFLDHVAELFAPLGQVRVKRMFGGAGVYCGDVMIALVAEDVLYLKTDDGNREDFESAGLEPFTYTARGKTTRMSYSRAPDDALESPALMRDWARGALAAALRSRK
ncbi:MAG: TfoX/Sxy family protein [Moraxellaceae bacterium]|nr:TfoX/Sxy family protein [Moraxellaceae bacterium]